MRHLIKLLLLFTASQAYAQSEKYPFCNLCQCVYGADDSTGVKVTCVNSDPDKPIRPLALTNSTWFNQAIGKPYPYSEVTLTNLNIIELNFTFPVSNVSYLNLANNDIYRITDSVFKNLQNMRILILSRNDLDLLAPDAFRGVYLEEKFMPLKSLKELRLDHNRLHTLKMDIFSHTTDIEILDLSFNPFQMIDKHTLIAISSLVYLKELNLGYTQIKTLPDSMLHTPKYLEILDLSGNPIDAIPKTLFDAHNLTTLYLNNTDFGNITRENGFAEIPTLKSLYLCHLLNLERIEPRSLSGLIGLEDLRITDNIKLTHVDPFALAKINEKIGGAIWPALKKLHLENNKLSYLDSDFLARWDALTELDLTANPWTCECENQWMVEDLMPLYMKIDKEKATQVKCGAPVEMVDYTFVELYERDYKMRCLDLFGAEPEKDAAMLVGILAGVLIAIPVILFAALAYQRKWFGLFSMCDNSPAAYSRRFYSSTRKDDYI